MVFLSGEKSVIVFITNFFSSSFSSAGTLHLPSSFSLIPDDFRIDRHVSLFHVNPSINGCDVNAMASASGLVSLPTSSKI